MSGGDSFSRLTWWVSPGLWALGKLPVLTPNASVSLRFRRQRTAVVSSNDKKMPNGILEEQGRGPGRAGPGGGGPCLPNTLTLK